MTPPADPRSGDPRAEIMVVCTANICRSPLAAAMLEEQARARLGADPPVRITSTGLHALEGRPAADGTLTVAADRGFDLGAHRGTRLDRAHVSRCDLVLTMTESHRAAVGARAPGSGARVFALREFARLVQALEPVPDDLAPRERLRSLVARAHGARPYVARPPAAEDVADPYGGPDAGYGRMAADVEELVAAIAPALFGPRR